MGIIGTPITAISDVDSYVTVAEGDAYFAKRLYSDVWDNATDNNKLRALIEATQAIERLNFCGRKTDDNQVFQVPRYDDSAIPTEIKSACFEIAIRLLDGINVESEIEALGISSEKFADAALNYRSGVPEHLQAGIVSYRAWTLLKPYLADHRSITVIRTS